MNKEVKNEQMSAYSEAVDSGLYAKRSGLVGKYDNVRHLWEDEITRNALRPYLQKLIQHTQSSMRRLRIMDLGCGSADGYELLAGIRYRDADLHETQIELLNPEILGLYKGIDLSRDLLDQALSIYDGNPKIVFKQEDFRKGLPLSKKEKPYDLYFSSYGTFSHHNEDETAVQLLTDIAKRTNDYCIIMCDWLGRYSYEWQTLWTNDLSKNRNMDYIVSYIYEKEERQRRREELEHLTLRLMSRQEAETIVKEASKKAGIEIKPLVFSDRSLFTGRHMDTAEYNPHAQPIRGAVNSLFEENLRTDLNSLIIDYVPKQDFNFLNDYFEYLQMCWNALVHYAEFLLEAYNGEKQDFSFSSSPVPASYPQPLREMMKRMKRVVGGVGWLRTGLPRENIIEPQLGYALRYLVTHLQRGQGYGHGLIGIFEVDKRK